MKWIVFLLLAPSVLACVVPQDGTLVDKSMQFCPNVYTINKGIRITGNNVNLDCTGTVLNGVSGAKGISIEQAGNVVVKGCRLLNYQTAFYVRASSRVFLLDNHIVNAKVGARFVGVTQSATLNHDVSLTTPFEILESTGNVLSLTNKRVRGAFCEDNFCNSQRSAIEQFMRPPTTKAQMQEWLGERVAGKSEKKLRAAVLEGIY